MQPEPVRIFISAREEHRQAARAVAHLVGGVAHLEVPLRWWDAQPEAEADRTLARVGAAAGADLLVLLQPLATPAGLDSRTISEVGAALGSGVPVLYCGHDWHGRPAALRHPGVAEVSHGWDPDAAVSALLNEGRARASARACRPSAGPDLGPLLRAWEAREEARALSRRVGEGLRDKLLDRPAEGAPGLGDAVRAGTQASERLAEAVRSLLVQAGLVQ